MYSLTFDNAAGVLVVTFEGFTPDEELARYEQDLRAGIADARRRVGRLRLLIDAIRGQVLPAAAAERLKTIEARLVRSPDDRVAVVLNSTLLKLQLKRIVSGDQTRIFQSDDEARAWLTT